VRGLAVITVHRTALQQDLAHHARSGQREGSDVATRPDDHRATVPVVEKRLRATREVRLTRRRSTRHTAERVTLRREEAVVEHFDGAGKGDDDPA
jgi:hypothetical protein